MRGDRLSYLFDLLAGQTLLLGGLIVAPVIVRAVGTGSLYVRLCVLYITLLPAFLFAEYRGRGTISLSSFAAPAWIMLIGYPTLMVVDLMSGESESTKSMELHVLLIGVMLWSIAFSRWRAKPPAAIREGGKDLDGPDRW